MTKCFNNKCNEMKSCDDIINDIKKRTKKWKRDTGKFNENQDDQVFNTKVGGVRESDSCNDMINNNDNIVEEVILENKILNNDSDDESLGGVEVSGELVVDEFERECGVRLGEYEMQRVNFPCGLSGARTRHAVSYTHLDVYKRQVLARNC